MIQVKCLVAAQHTDKGSINDNLTIKKVFLFCSMVRICSGINKLLQMYYYNSASRVFMVPEGNIFFVSFKAEDSEQFYRMPLEKMKNRIL